jgi:hypothetical protein
MRRTVLLSLLVLAVPAGAQTPVEHPADCRVAEAQVEQTFPLPQTARAISAKRLDVLVLGAGSSALPGPDGQKRPIPRGLRRRFLLHCPMWRSLWLPT